MAHDDYKQLDLSQIVTVPPNGKPLEQCPICGSDGQLWQYSTSETSPRKLLVMCSHGDLIGPQDGLTNEGCPFYMPPDGHYRETIRDAVRYWNELARAITALRQANHSGVAVDRHQVSCTKDADAPVVQVVEPLTAEEIEVMWSEARNLPGWTWDAHKFARAIEANRARKWGLSLKEPRE